MAIVDYSSCIEINPEAYWCYIKRGISQKHLKDYEKAMTDINYLIQNKNDVPDAVTAHAYFVRAQMMEENGKIDDAISDYSEAIKYRDKMGAFQASGKIHSIRAGLYFMKGLNNLAYDDLNKACDLGHKKYCYISPNQNSKGKKGPDR